MRLARAASTAIATIAAWALLQPPAAAGGSPIEWERYAYEPGDVAVADQPYSPGCCDRGTPEDGPYDVWLYDPPGDWWEGPPPRDQWIHLGRIGFYEGAGSRTYLRIEFTVPDLEPGEYVVTHCNEGCATQLGDLMETPIRIVGSDAEGRMLQRIERLERTRATTVGRLRDRLRSLRGDIVVLKVRIDRLEERDAQREREVRRLLRGSEDDQGLALSFLGAGALIAVAAWRPRRRRHTR